jgi:hypothetical protein
MDKDRSKPRLDLYLTLTSIYFIGHFFFKNSSNMASEVSGDGVTKGGGLAASLKQSCIQFLSFLYFLFIIILLSPHITTSTGLIIILFSLCSISQVE